MIINGMKQFNDDIEHWKNYDFVVINDNLEKCYKEIITYIHKKINKLDTGYDENKIKNHIMKLRN